MTVSFKIDCSPPVATLETRVPLPKTFDLLVTCEHGGHEFPPELERLFAGTEDLLASHRGWDAGALDLACDLAATAGAPLFSSTTSRLVVDLNRSLDHPRLFSAMTRDRPAIERRRLIEEHYRPYRQAVEDHIAKNVTSGSIVLHVAVHSFTPCLDGKTRSTDIGWLYDPSRPLEKAWSQGIGSNLRRHRPDLRIHCNKPYRGVSDGFPTALRRRFSSDRYVGIELEVNQRLVWPSSADSTLGRTTPSQSASARDWQCLKDDLVEEIVRSLHPTKNFEFLPIP